MTVRKIVCIDQERCNGCGKCIPNCREGALQIVDGKARIVNDQYCDGLGACLGVCPEGAIAIVEREAEEFDESAAAARDVAKAHHQAQERHTDATRDAVCPGTALLSIPGDDEAGVNGERTARPSALSQWPVQLRLAPVKAPFFDGADLLLAADCVPFAFADFHGRLLRGRKLLVGCPKLDDVTDYAQKLTAILKQNDIRSLTVVHMEVPCCYGLVALAQRAVADSGKQIVVEEVVVGVRGTIKEAVGDAARRRA
jgi:Fe-S-cluster-containing hydrogenase component 2